MFHAWDDRVDEVLRALGSEASDVRLDRENEFLRAELARAREESAKRLAVIRELETLANDRGRWNAELQAHVSLRDDRIAELARSAENVTRQRDDARAHVADLLETSAKVEAERDALASERRDLAERLSECTAERDVADARSRVLDRLLAKERGTTAALAAEIARLADPVAVALDAARATRDRVARRWRRRP
ncbi:MAG: hypothetical protein U0169_15410 [Polyangiaceae bacterium]